MKSYSLTTRAWSVDSILALVLMTVVIDVLPGIAQPSDVVPSRERSLLVGGSSNHITPIAPINSDNRQSATPLNGDSSAASATVVNLPSDYILGSGDRLKIEVFNVPELSGEFDVSVDGLLNLPWVGALPVQGVTVSGLRTLLFEQYSQFVTRPPTINLQVVIPRPIRVAVAGEVYRPGTYTIEFSGDSSRTKDASVYRFPTLTQLIQKAGGITQIANVRNIQIRRSVAANQPQVFDVDLWKLIQSGDIVQDISLRDGDAIMIPTASKIDLGESVRLGRVNFAPDKISVQVVGEVVTPGSVSIPPNTSLNQAILTAGGFKNDRARSTAVELIRLNPDGTVKRQTLAVNFATQPNDQTNPLLQPNDVIIVKRNSTGSIVDAFSVVGSIFSPFYFLTNLFNVLR